ncbi:MAG: glycosyl hydrolase family 18 protein [Clostridia bacterium]|nr:glycosyl hydrolase family 18 protein [Clostridia bacterium]
MSNSIKRIIATIIIIISLTSSLPVISETLPDTQKFSDVPKNSISYKAIHNLRAMNVFEAAANNKFGYGKPITKSEFISIIVKLMKCPLYKPEKGSFSDNQNKNKAYFSYIETALKYGIIKKDSPTVRPVSYLTREEMAVMLVRYMGYDTLAVQKSISSEKPFSDITRNAGYISIARDFGIVGAKSGTSYAPNETVKKEDAALYLFSAYEKINSKIKEMNAFYALNAFRQKDMIKSLSSVSFGWSRLEYDKDNKKVFLNMEDNDNADFYLPEGFSIPFNTAREYTATTQLSIYASQETLVWNDEKNSYTGLLELALSDKESRKSIVESIIEKIVLTKDDNASISFDGVVIDFECLKGKKLRDNFNSFITELKPELKRLNKKLYVAVHPKRKNQSYYDGYDYKTIGNISDKVILMAHDYNATSLTETDMKNNYTLTPLTPIDEIYYALKAITDKKDGVADVNKIWLQISFGTAQWQSKDNSVINKNAKTPSYEQIRDRIINKDNMKNVTISYSKIFENPYVKYYNEKENIHNRIWYEDSRSVIAKIKLAKMFGIKGISLWRLGNIPDFEEVKGKAMYLDIWQQILKTYR